MILKFGGQQPGQSLYGIHMLAHLGALKIMTAVQPGAQDEVSL
jgi:hypothetical protein